MPEIPPKVLQDVLRNLEETQKSAIKAIQGVCETAKQNIEKVTTALEDELVTSSAKKKLKSGIPATLQEKVASLKTKVMGGFDPAKHTPDWLSVELRKLFVSRDLKSRHYTEVPFSILAPKSHRGKELCKFEVAKDPDTPFIRVKVLSGPGIETPRWLPPEQTYAFIRWVTAGDRMIKTMAGIGFGSAGTALAATLIYNTKEASEEHGRSTQARIDKPRIEKLEGQVAKLRAEKDALRKEKE